MKTYKEALLMMGAKPSDREGVARAFSAADRFMTVAEEITAEPKTRDMLIALAEMGGLTICPCDVCTKGFSFAMNAFIQGVRVGIEMEKNENPIT